MLKKKIIDWILQRDQADYHIGLSLLKQISPLHPLLQRPDNAVNKRQLLQDLGTALRTYDFARHVEPAPAPQKSTQRKHKPQPAQKREILQDAPDPATLPGISDAGKINLILSDKYKLRAYYHNKLREATSDAQRRDILKDQQIVQDQITYHKKLLREVSRGEKITIDAESHRVSRQSTNKLLDQDDFFAVPEDKYELKVKLDRYRQAISKRKANIRKLESKGEQDSPRHQRLVRELKQYQDAKQQLETAQKVRT